MKKNHYQKKKRENKMEMKNSRYGNKMDKYLKDLVVMSERSNDIETAFSIQSEIVTMLMWRLEECEEALKYPQGSTMKRFFEK
jgi:hypothetical protein